MQKLFTPARPWGPNDHILLVLTYLLELIMPEFLVMQYERTNMVPYFLVQFFLGKSPVLRFTPSNYHKKIQFSTFNYEPR